MEELKTVKQVFRDYNSNSFALSEAKVVCVNIYKKTNILEIKLKVASSILMKDLADFEKYLAKRFNFKDIDIKIESDGTDENVNNKIQTEWTDIVEYMAYKHPLTKALLKNSAISIEDNRINVKLAMKGKMVLEARGFEKILSSKLADLYHKNYVVSYQEEITQEMIEQYQEHARELEKQAIMLAQKEAMEQAEEKRQEKEKKIQGESAPIPDAPMPTDADIPFEPEQEENSPLIYGRSLKIKEELSKVIDLSVDSGKVLLDGEILNTDSRELKSGKFLVTFDLYDGSSTITCKAFVEADKHDAVIKRLKSASGVKVNGTAQFDPFAKELGVIANVIIESTGIKREVRKDEAKVKRVELHMHTQMSQMDGMTAAKDLLKRAVKWGMKSIAITDHGVVQAFPDAHKYLEKDHPDLKVIYGVEAYLAPDKTPCVSFSKNQPLDDTTYCVLDLETTGFSFRTEKITEIGIMKVRNGEVIDELSTFVNPEKPIPQRVVEVTNITDDMVKDAPKIEEILPKVIEFVGDSVLVAHNADFDIGFLKYNCTLLGLKLGNTYLDTLRLAKDLFPEYKKYKLGIIAENLGIKVDVAHRALDDVDTTVKVLNVMFDMLREKGVKTLDDIDEKLSGKADYKSLPTYHAIILAKDYVGLRNLYKLISVSHLHYFYKKPRILKSLYKKYSEGLILGSACEQGEIYRAIIAGKTDEEIEEIAADYDYLEIQPLGNNMFMVRNETVKSVEDLKDINRKIVALGEKLQKPVVATCDVHFMDPQDEIYRRILMAGQGYDDADDQAPLYLRTTEEMLKEFDYLGEEKAYEVVVTNTNKISDMCEKISPISPEKCPPHIDGCEETIKNIAYSKAHELYGDPLPEIVQARLDKELHSIITNGFSVMYIIAQKLVWKSNEDGYIVGSRGSVGSSLAATMAGITEVNPLSPHYLCPECFYVDFDSEEVKKFAGGAGCDMPDKVCPNCGHKLNKLGFDIPFETFLGFKGNKEPDIDLNFSNEYQSKAHAYTEVIFGKGQTFKAGTIGTVAEKTAYGYVLKYLEERGKVKRRCEIERIAEGCIDIRRTTGQHPGGIVVLPIGDEIHSFTPVQHPANDVKSGIVTTHFDYHSIDHNLLKLDILGHLDPTMIRMLQDLTGIDPLEIPLDSREVMSLFKDTSALGITPEDIGGCKLGALGIPEFGTDFAMQMLIDTKPQYFSDLVRIAGLSHGTDVWLGNAQTLLKEGKATISTAICTRDDIMIYLIQKGLESELAFTIMEKVRKGKGLTPEWEQIMREHGVPDWYIWSCNKIQYMFPKAHAAAYVMMAWRVAYCKVFYPLAYYCAYYSIRANAFDYEKMAMGRERLEYYINDYKAKKADGTISNVEDDELKDMRIVQEMYARGFEFVPIDIYKAKARSFQIIDGKIMPSFKVISKVGESAGESIEIAARDGEFLSKDDLRQRARIGQTVIEKLGELGLLDGMAESNQLSLFDVI